VYRFEESQEDTTKVTWCAPSAAPAATDAAAGEKRKREDDDVDGAAAADVRQLLLIGRGLHSSTLQLNLSAFCVTWGAVKGCFGGVWGW
jgi:hypothetical protein